MTDRSVVVRLRAEVDGFKRGMAEAAAAARKTTEATTKTGQEAATAGERMMAGATKSRAAWENAGKAMLITGAALAAGVGVAVKTFMDFDAQMSQVKTLSHATSYEMDQLTAAALSMGQGIGFSATQTAQAETELVKAGLSVKDIMGGALVGALNLAAAGQIDVGKATEIAAAAMTQFKLSGKDVPHIADLLAAGADKALGSVGDLGYALSSSGTVAAQFGLSIEETVGTLAEFAQNAQIGEKGGTLLRQMLLQLVNPSKQAKDLMQQYGFSLYDANGKMVGTSVLAGRLQKSFGSLTPEVKNHALAVIFGTHAIAGANILMSDGAKVNAEWVKSVNDSGFAAQQAAGKMDNLKGDLTKLRAALENDLIKTGSTANGTLRLMTQGVADVAKVYGALPRPMQGAALGLTAVAAATALAGGAFLSIVPRIAATRLAIAEIGPTAEAAAGRIGMVAKGIGILSVAWAGFAAASSGMDALLGVNVAATNHAGESLLAYAKAGKDAEGMTRLASRGFDSLGTAVKLAFSDSTLTKIRDFGSFVGHGFGALGATEFKDYTNFFKEVDAGLSNLVESGHGQEAAKIFGQISAEAKRQGYTVGQVADMLPAYSQAMSGAADAAKKQAEAVAKSTPPTQAQADAMRLLGGAATQSSDEVKALAKQLEDFEKAVSQSFTSATDVIGSFQAKTGKGVASVATQVERSYRRTTKEAQKFATDIQAAVKRGLDPAVVEQLLEAGPKQAGPILQAMVHDHSGRLIKMANQSATALGKIQAQVVEEARLTNLAMTASTDTMTHDLANAMKISEAEASKGGRATARGLSKQLNIGAADVKRIANEFGISLATGVGKGTSKAGTSVKGFQGVIRQTPTHHQTDFTVSGIKAAQQSVIDFQHYLKGLPTQKVVQLLYQKPAYTPSFVIPAPKKHKADGGLVGGNGGPRADDQLILASSNEFVVNAASTAKHLPELMAINADRFADGGMVTAGSGSSGRMFAGAVPRYADGGRVGTAPTVAPVVTGGPSVTYTGDFYAYNPADMTRQQQTAMRDLLAVAHL